MGVSPAADKTILLVEDSAVVRNMLMQIIENEGYRVSCATNGVEALELLHKKPPPRLILLDRMMPLMNAEEFLRERRGDPALASIPVIIISSYSQDERSFGLHNIDGYLEKPIDLSTLLDTVRHYCD